MPFLEKTANRLMLESVFSILEKTANCLISESMFYVLEKTANRLEKMVNRLEKTANRLFPESVFLRQLKKWLASLKISYVNRCKFKLKECFEIHSLIKC